jgi:SNF2 family DNA or RNA helicase
LPLADVTDPASNRIVIQTTYTDRDRMLLIPGSMYQNDGSWKVPLSWASCVVLRQVFGADLQLGPGLVSWAGRERQRVNRGLELRDVLDLPAGSAGAQAIDRVEAGSDWKLKGYQRAGVGYLVVMETAGLFDAMGTGKTATTIRALQVLRELGRDPFPAVVVAPNSVKATVWPVELERWAPELSFTVVDGSASVRRKQVAEKSDVTIINWEAVRLHSRVAGYGDIRLTDKDKQEKELDWLGPRTVICDEAHRLRDPKSAQSRAVTHLLHRARFRYLLTGTPVNDDAFDLWGLLHAAAPLWHHGKTRYGDRYVQTGYNLYGGLVVMGLKPETRAEFDKVTLPLYRRIPRELVLPQLPPKLPVQTRHTAMTPKQAKAYREMEEYQLAHLNELLEAPTPLAGLTRLLQFAAASARVEERVDSKGITHHDVILEEPSGKVDDLVELLEEMGNEPLVVGAVSAQLVDLAEARLKNLGISCGVIAGRVPVPERPAVVSQFQAGKLRVILIVLSAGAEGLTLTRARTLLFMQEDWRPDLNSQFVGRVDRIGAEVHDSIQVIRQVTPGTVEERKPAALAAKGERIEDVLRDRATLMRLLGAA